MNHRNIRLLWLNQNCIIARPVPQKVQRNKRLRVEEAQPLLLFQRYQNRLSGNCGFKTLKITHVTDKHNVHLSYSSPHAYTMGLGSMDATVNMSKTFDYAICNIPYPEWVFLSVLKKPPDGIISNGIMFMTISSIFVTVVSQACLRLWCQIALRDSQRFLWLLMVSSYQ